VTTMTHLASLCQRVAQASLLLGASLATSAALAVNNLPGGPAVNQLDLHPPVTRIASDIQGLHVGILIVCLVIFVLVFGVMFYSVLKHRKSLGAKAANFHESVGVEIAWTVLPLIIVIGMGAAATKSVVADAVAANPERPVPSSGPARQVSLAGSKIDTTRFNTPDPLRPAMNQSSPWKVTSWEWSRAARLSPAMARTWRVRGLNW